jgi:hypothetical protein
MKQFLKILVVTSSAFVVGLPSVGIAGSTLGGVPSNGGGITFGAPATTLTNVVGGQAVADAIASGSPAQVESALLAAIALNFPGGFGSANLDPLPGQTGAQTVAILTSLIRNFAAAVGLDPDSSPAIQQLLAIAATASA